MMKTQFDMRPAIFPFKPSVVSSTDFPFLLETELEIRNNLLDIEIISYDAIDEMEDDKTVWM